MDKYDILFEQYFLQELSIDDMTDRQKLRLYRDKIASLDSGEKMVKNRLKITGDEQELAQAAGNIQGAKNISGFKHGAFEPHLKYIQRKKAEYFKKIDDLEYKLYKQDHPSMSDRASKISKAVSDHPVAAGLAGVAVALALGVAAYKLYKRFYSKAAKSCNKYSGKSKTICMAKYRVDSLKKAKSVLSKKSRECSKTKEPEKCKNELAKQLSKFDKKIFKAERSVQKVSESSLSVYLKLIQE